MKPSDRWTEDQRIFVFKNQMKGKAASFVQRAAEESYPAYVEALKSGLYDTKDHYHQLLQARRQEPDETFAQLSLALQQLAEQAFGSMMSEAKSLALREPRFGK